MKFHNVRVLSMHRISGNGRLRFWEEHPIFPILTACEIPEGFPKSKIHPFPWNTSQRLCLLLMPLFISSSTGKNSKDKKLKATINIIDAIPNEAEGEQEEERMLR